MIRDEAALAELLRQVREFVDSRAIPNEELVDREGEIPDAIVQEMRDGGFFGWSIPQEHGGSGLTVEELVRAALEIGRAAPAFRARAGANTGIGSQTIIDHGTQEQKARYLPRLASGDFTAAFALTEPNAGSEASNIAVMATRDGDHYVLTGDKAFITNAPIADLYTVFARTDPASSGSRGISAFLVERGLAGFEPGEQYRKLGQNGSPVGSIRITEARVHRSSLLGGEEHRAFTWAMQTLTKQRIHLAALTTGLAARLLEEMVTHARTRVQFGQPIGEHQLVLAMIADTRTALFAARSMVLEAARAMDAGQDVRTIASACKLFATESAVRASDRAVQLYGGSGYLEDHRVAQLYRDARLFTLYEGTSEIHKVTIGRRTQQEEPATWL